MTASGKVIETDTEAIQKKLEQKREERKALPVEELTVPEQIERKEEEEKKLRKAEYEAGEKKWHSKYCTSSIGT